MSGCVEITLWLHEYKLEALERQLEQRETCVEKQMQDMLLDLYAGAVPIKEQEQIQQRIDEEQARESAERAANTKWAAYHVTEQGGEQYFKTPTGDELLTAAGRLRSYLCQNDASRWPRFSSLLFHRQEITAKEFEQMTAERMENTGKITGVFEIDFDAGTFSAVNTMDGWQTYRIHDMSVAAYHAFRKQGISADQRWDRLLTKLDGKELTPSSEAMALSGSRRLPMEQVIFQGEISECGSLLNFYIPVTFEPDPVFGTHVTETVNDDYLNIYADFDLDSGEVCEALTVIYVCGDGSEETYRYPLTGEERDTLRGKMDDYCRAQSELNLEEYRAQYLAEMDGPAQEQTL